MRTLKPRAKDRRRSSRLVGDMFGHAATFLYVCACQTLGNFVESKLGAVVVGISVSLAPMPVSAHHSFTAEFDAKKPLVLEGTVTKTEWINPHSWVHLSVTRPNGKIEAWMIELGTVGTLVRKGFTKQVLPVGSKVKVTGFQAKDGSLKANGRDITLSDGRSFFVGSSGAGAPSEKK